MKRFGIVSYNIYCNFTNYGSALQSYALSQAINKTGVGKWESVLVDYCPDILKDKDALNPIRNMWDTDDESIRMCELSMPAIRENYKKFDRFYHERFNRTTEKYTAENFNQVIEKEKLDGFVCGSDTIFCIDEFGFDDGYYANYDCMKKGYTVSYAASFGDAHFNDESYQTLNQRLQNFKYIAIREKGMVPYIRRHTDVPVRKVIDPTLLLTAEDYDEIAAKRCHEKKYLFLYVRRYNPAMEKYAKKIARENGWEIVEVSLRATNAEKHRMFYEAGVEEYLSLIKHAEAVVTNSYHGLLFALQYKRPVHIFSREQCDTKIDEVLDWLDMQNRKLITGQEQVGETDYEEVHKKIAVGRVESLSVLTEELDGCKAGF